MTRLYNLMLRLVKDERGQDMVEYALLAGFIAVAAGAILPGISNNISIIFSKMASLVGNAASTCEDPPDFHPPPPPQIQAPSILARKSCPLRTDGPQRARLASVHCVAQSCLVMKAALLKSDRSFAGHTNGCVIWSTT